MGKKGSGLRQPIGFKTVFTATVLAACILVLRPMASAAAGADSVRHVLLLHSYHPGMTWVQNIEKGVRETLQDTQGEILLHIDYMDSKRYHGRTYGDLTASLLAHKYSDLGLSLIMSSDNNAFDFLREHRSLLFPGVPVVFCGVNDLKADDLADQPDMTGVEEVISPLRTVEIMRKLHPEIRRIYVINDYLKTGRAWQRDIETALSGLQGQIEIEYNDNLSLDELKRTIQKLDANTAVLLGVFFSDRDGTYFTYETVGARLTAGSPVPVYCLLNFNLRDGVVGGNVISGYAQGRRMAQMAGKILDGTPPSDLPVVRTGVNTTVFDYHGLTRFNIDEDRLPEDARVINRPFSFYDTYRGMIWTATGAFAALLAIVLVLVVNIQSRKQAQAELNRHRDQLKEMVALQTDQLTRANGDLAVKNDELEQIVYVASHDLRSPLVNIDGYAKELGYSLESLTRLLEKLQDASLRQETISLVDEDMAESLHYIRTSAEKMDKLLMGLLRLSRSGRAALEVTALDMEKMISEIFDSIEFQIRQAGVSVEMGSLPPCRGDAVQVNQVFSNLIDNALKYRDPDRKGRIRVSGRQDGDWCVYTVEDNGIGMDARHRDKIFNIFHRLDPSRGQGEGLGLTIVKRILDRLDGTVSVSSDPGEGSRFYVTLPACDATKTEAI